MLEMDTLSQPAWYCARTKPKHEQIAAASLARQLGLEVFNPRLKMERATSRGVVRVVESLFPCYVFVRCGCFEDVGEIRYVTGISSLVRFGQRIATVPEAVIDELRQCFQTDDPLSVENTLRPGTEVTVAQGAFEGFHGIVVRVLPAKQRVQILLDFLGRTTLAELDRTWLSLEDRFVLNMVPGLAITGRGGLATAA
jgi:transcriptional antiterminator RfaH